MSAILECLLNTFWQAAAVAFVVWAGVSSMPRINAATRGAVWWSVLALILLLPVIRASNPTPNREGVPIGLRPTKGNEDAVVGRVVNQVVNLRPIVNRPAEPARPTQGVFNGSIHRGTPKPPVRLPAGSWPLSLLAFWCAVCFTQMMRLAISYRHLRLLKRDALPAAPEQRANLDAWLSAYGVRRPVHLLVSHVIPVPVAVGFLHPAILLPEALLAKLTAVELDHVLLHELAHLARRDDWTNLLTRIAWAVLALHPVAAFALRQIDRERELACDDWVVSATGAPRPYAASLARLFELCAPGRRTLLASGIAGGGSQLGNRIAALLRRGREFTPRASALRVSLCTAALLLFVIAAARAPAWMAFAQTTAPHPEAPATRVEQESPAPAPAPVARSRSHRAPTPTPPAATPLPAPAPPVTPAPAGNSLLAALVSNGYGDLSVDEIVDLKTQGVSPDFIAGMAHAGMGKLPPRSLIALKQQGVHPEYVHDILALGFGPYTTNQIIEFKNQGVPVELFAALKEYGLLHADPNEIREARIHGLGPGNLREARKYSASLTLKQIIRLKQAGVI